MPRTARWTETRKNTRPTRPGDETTNTRPMSELAGKQVLIIDALPGMRAQLQKAFQSFGFPLPHAVADIKDALWHLQSVNYSIILCDYDLGEGTNGQQFLEYLRTSDLISRNTIFIMATAERTYERVMVVAE